MLVEVTLPFRPNAALVLSLAFATLRGLVAGAARADLSCSVQGDGARHGTSNSG